MKRHYIPLIALLSLLPVLAACMPATGEGADLATPVVVTEQAALPTPTLTMTVESTVMPVAPTEAVASATPQPTVTATVDVPNQEGTPENDEVVVITEDFTNVRRGPGLAYEVSHVLAPGTTAPVQGRDEAGSWWAVPGPGDGPGPVGWVSAAVVAVQGDVSGVPVLATPPLDDDLPVVGNSGAPPGGEVCVAVHAGPGDGGPTYLRQQPDKGADAAAILGLDRWADIVETENGWYRVRDSQDAGGWVHEDDVALNGDCALTGGPPDDLPVVEDPGAPPSNVCVALRPGQHPAPIIHLGPGRQFAPVARLGNWAEVLKSEVGWHQILLGPAEIGWISDEDVDLGGPCETTGDGPSSDGPERIVFEPGATSTTLEGMVEGVQDEYLFHAAADQQLTIELISEENLGLYALRGMSDGHIYKALEEDGRTLAMTLPLTQDYLLVVGSAAGSQAVGYRLVMTIES